MKNRKKDAKFAFIKEIASLEKFREQRHVMKAVGAINKGLTDQEEPVTFHDKKLRIKKYQSRKRVQTGKSRPILKHEVTESHWVEVHNHQNAIKSIKDKITKPVVAKEQAIPIAVLKLQRRKLEINDPIGNPVYFQRKPGQDKLAGSLDPFVKKVMVNSVRIESPTKHFKAATEADIQRLIVLEKIKRIKQEKREMLRQQALA